MNVLVIGATGNSGRLIVERALDAGHEVTAFARKPDALKSPRLKLARVAGDVLDAAALDKVMPGHEVVVFAAGSGNTRPSILRREGIKQTIAAMKKHGVKKLVALSGQGAGESMAALPFIFRKVIAPLLLKGLLEDQTALEVEVRGSGLRAVVVRPGQMVEQSPGSTLKVSLDGRGVGSKVTYADVAAFVVEQLGGEKYVGQFPSIGY